MLILNICVSANSVFVIKSYEPEEICLILENRGKHPLKVIGSLQKPYHRIQRIREPCRIKQFMVTNCSKEQPGSIVNETLKNGTLMLKATSKESDFHADSKYISLIKFSLGHQKLRA